MGESKDERRKWEGRAQSAREEERRRKQRETGVPAQVRAQLLAYSTVLEDALGDVLGSGESVKLIVEPDGRGGARFTLKTVQGVSTGRRGVYLHGLVSDAGDVPEAIRRVIEKGDWRVDRYWKP